MLRCQLLRPRHSGTDPESSDNVLTSKPTFSHPSPLTSTGFLPQWGDGAQCSRCYRGGTGLGERNSPAASPWGWARKQRGSPGGGKVTERVGMPRSVLSPTNLHSHSTHIFDRETQNQHNLNISTTTHAFGACGDFNLFGSYESFCVILIS